MKELTTIIILTLSCIGVLSAQDDDYTKVITIKQPYHTFNATEYQDTKKGFQKINGFKISEDQKLLVISYAENPTSIALYEIGTWEQKGVYKVIGSGVEINSSYFSDDGKLLYVKYDRFSPNFKVIDFKTGYVKKIDCSKTPKGCYYEEVTQDKREIYTKNRKYYISVSKFDASDTDIYVKKLR